MTALEKQKIASFLDMAKDLVATGYHGESKNYQFKDDDINDPALPPPLPKASVQKIENLDVLVIGEELTQEAETLLDNMLKAIDLYRNKNCIFETNIDTTQIAVLKPRFILVLGEAAALRYLETEAPIKFLREKFTDYKINDFVIPLIVTYHPNAIIENNELKRPAWEDLKLLRSRLD